MYSRVTQEVEKEWKGCLKRRRGIEREERSGRSSLARAPPPFFRIVFAGMRLMRAASPRRSWRRGLWMGRRRRRRRRSTYEGKRTSREKSVWPRAPTITVDRRSHVVLLRTGGTVVRISFSVIIIHPSFSILRVEEFLALLEPRFSFVSCIFLAMKIVRWKIGNRYKNPSCIPWIESSVVREKIESNERSFEK